MGRPLRAALLLLIGSAVLAEESGRVKAFRKAFSAGTPDEKAAQVRILAVHWDAEVSETLLALVKPDADPEALVAIADMAGRQPDAGATAILKAILAIPSRRAWRPRGAAAAALLDRNAPGDFELAVEAGGDKDDRTVMMLCEGLGVSRHAKAVHELKRFLGHDDWRVRAAAIGALSSRSGSDEAVKALIGRLPKEDGRLVGDLLEALKRLTGQDLGPDPAAWNAWLRRTRDPGNAAVPGAEEVFTHSAAAPVTYHGVTTYSRRILFVFDRTESMHHNDFIGKEKRHLIEAIESLGRETGGGKDRCGDGNKKPPPVLFNILMFSDGVVEFWKSAMVPASADNKRAAIAFVQKQVPVGWTNTWTAMKAALDMASTGSCKEGRQRLTGGEDRCRVDDEPYGYGKNEADTIFLLSDGLPSLPPPTMAVDDWAGVADRIRDYNRTKKVVIHTIGIGSDMPFMQRVARENGGTYTNVP